MKNRVKAWLYQLPILLIMIIVLIGGIYARVSKAYDFKSTGSFITFIIVVLAIIVCFFVGKYYETKTETFAKFH